MAIVAKGRQTKRKALVSPVGKRSIPQHPARSGADEFTLEIGGKSITCTRLSKVLYPKARFTTAEVIDYYVRVAQFLLPHLKDRPITLKRFPDGVSGDSYWEKDAPSFAPEWVKTFPVPRHAGGPDIHYIVINDSATLAWTANIAALELHPFLHRAPQIQRPTSIVFDLDPGAGADIFTCAEVALLIRDLFARLGLEMFPKVSGSKGLQLYLPLNTAVSYDITQPSATPQRGSFNNGLRPRVAEFSSGIGSATGSRRGRTSLRWSSAYRTGLFSLFPQSTSREGLTNNSSPGTAPSRIWKPPTTLLVKSGAAWVRPFCWEIKFGHGWTARPPLKPSASFLRNGRRPMPS
jgi:DNA ligase D-like protein (predicted polymerase)